MQWFSMPGICLDPTQLQAVVDTWSAQDFVLSVGTRVSMERPLRSKVALCYVMGKYLEIALPSWRACRVNREEVLPGEGRVAIPALLIGKINLMVFTRQHLTLQDGQWQISHCLQQQQDVFQSSLPSCIYSVHGKPKHLLYFFFFFF